MAYHAIASTSSFTANWPTTSVGDDVYAVCSCDADGDPSATWTVPSGWTQIGPNQWTQYDGQQSALFWYTGNSGQGAPASPPTTATFACSDDGGAELVVMVSFSGRSHAQTFSTETKQDLPNTSPTTVPLTGGTSAAGDDLLVITSFDPGDTDARGAAITGSPGTFTSRIAAQNQYSDINVSTLDDFAGGATGTLSDVITNALGAGQDCGAVMCWVVSLPAAGAGTPTVPLTSYPDRDNRVFSLTRAHSALQESFRMPPLRERTQLIAQPVFPDVLNKALVPAASQFVTVPESIPEPITWYFKDTLAGGQALSGNGTLQTGGTPPSVSTMATGWVLSTTHTSTEYSIMTYGSAQPATSWQTTNPAAAPSTFLTACFRTDVPFTGQFLGGSWSIFMAAIFSTIASSGVFDLSITMWKSSDRDGVSGFGGSPLLTLGIGSFSATVSTQQNVGGNTTIGAVTCHGEYLFFEIIMIVGAGAVSFTGSELQLIQDGLHAYVISPPFNPAPVVPVIGYSTVVDRLDRQLFPAGQHQVFALAPLPIAASTPTNPLTSYPDLPAFTRPASSSVASATSIVPEGKQPYDWPPQMPDVLLKSAFLTGHHLALVLSLKPERTSVLASTYADDIINIRRFLAPWQMPVTGEPSASERTTALACIYTPDAFTRAVFSVSQQMAITGESPLPERILPMFWEYHLDSYLKPLTGAYSPAFAFAPAPLDTPLDDLRVNVYFNAKDVALATLSGSQVLLWPNLGTDGGNFVPGTNAQVTGQGTGPTWNATGMGSLPGITFASASQTTLKVPIGTEFNVASGRTNIAIFASVSVARQGTGANQIVACIGQQAVEGSIADLGTGTSNTEFDAEAIDGSGHEEHYHPSTSFVPNTVVTISQITSSTGTALRLNGVSLGSGLNGSFSGFTADHAYVGVASDAYANAGDAFYLDGTIGILLIVSGPLSVADIAKFEAFVSGALAPSEVFPDYYSSRLNFSQGLLTANHPSFAFAPQPVVTTVPAQSSASWPDITQKVSVHASQQQASPSLAPVPEGIIDLSWDPVYQSWIDRRIPVNANTTWLSLPPFPERTLPPAYVQVADSVYRPMVAPWHQSFTFSPFPLPNSIQLGWSMNFPDRTELGARRTAEYQAYASSIAPERTSPLAQVGFVDRPDRQVVGVHQQFFTPVFAPRPEETSLITAVSFDARVPRLVGLGAEQQMAFAPSSLVPIIPKITPPYSQDVINRQTLSAANHPYFSMWTVPLPVSIQLGWSTNYPDRTPLSPSRVAENQAYASAIFPPYKSLFSTSQPDFLNRAILPVASYPFVTGEYPRPEMKLPPAFVSFSDRTILGASLPVASYPFVTSVEPYPERTSPPSFTNYSDFVFRFTLGAWNQPFATTVSPKPEAKQNLDWWNYNQDIINKAGSVANQPSFAFDPIPFANQLILLWSSNYPDSLVLTAKRSADFPPYTSNLVPERKQVPAFVSLPDHLDRAVVRTADQFFVPSFAPKPERSQVIAVTLFADRAPGPARSPEFPAYTSNIRPERVQAIAAVSAPDRPDRAVYGPQQQPYVSAFAPKPERKSPIAIVVDQRAERAINTAYLVGGSQIPPQQKVLTGWGPYFDDRVPPLARRVPDFPYVSTYMPAPPERNAPVWSVIYPDRFFPAVFLTAEQQALAFTYPPQLITLFGIQPPVLNLIVLAIVMQPPVVNLECAQTSPQPPVFNLTAEGGTG